MKIYALWFDQQLPQGDFSRLLQFVGEDKKYRIQRFWNWMDAHRVLYADLLIRHLIIVKTGNFNENISFETNAFSKPFVNTEKDFFFNLSHSGNWVVCAIAKQPVGIDIEQIKPVGPEVMLDVLSPQEYDEIIQLEESQKLSSFFSIWTIKETYLKAVGKGLESHMNVIHTKKLKNGKIVLSSHGKIQKNIFFRTYALDKDYRMAVCAVKDGFPESVIIKDTNVITTFFH